MAPEGFMIDVLTNLDSTLYLPGTPIAVANTRVEELVVIAEGSCKLYGFY